MMLHFENILNTDDILVKQFILLNTYVFCANLLNKRNCAGLGISINVVHYMGFFTLYCA